MKIVKRLTVTAATAGARDRRPGRVRPAGRSSHVTLDVAERPSLINLAPSHLRAWPSTLAPGRLNAISEPTPFLICDLSVIERRHRELTALLPDVRIHYAVKCNPAPEILATVARLGSSFEIASIYELDMVRATGVPPASVLYSNTVKPPAHIAAAWAAGVFRFAFDSEDELRKLAVYAPGCSVYVRLAVEDDQSLFPLSSRFGTSVGEAFRLLNLARQLGLDPYGVTFHVGSQCSNPRAWERAIARCGTLLRRLEPVGIRLRMLDLGGGMPARYVDHVPPLAEIAAAIRRGVDALPYRPEFLVAEPGRVLVAESGVVAATVIGKGSRDGKRWVHLDVGGYNGLMEAIQTGGRWQFPLFTSRVDHFEAPSVVATVTGPTCDSSDLLFHDVLVPATLAVGDRIYIGTAGAYTTSYASHFNGFPPPTPLFLEPGRVARHSSLDELAVPA
jgi:ornithine decarboxylase